MLEFIKMQHQQYIEITQSQMLLENYCNHMNTHNTIPEKAPMCCVMPPASLAATDVFLRLSKSVVLPWSTWPMTVTTGGRGLSTDRSRRCLYTSSPSNTFGVYPAWSTMCSATLRGRAGEGKNGNTLENSVECWSTVGTFISLKDLSCSL